MKPICKSIKIYYHLYIYIYKKMLFQSLESLGIKIGTISAALIGMDKLGIRDLILANNTGGDLEEVVRYAGYLLGTEWAADKVAVNLLGMRGINLHTDLGHGFMLTFAVNVATVYVLEKTNVLDGILDMLPNDTVSRAVGNAVVYTLVQEISYMILTKWWSSTSGDYGQKFNF